MGRTLALFSLLLAACTMDEPDPPVPPAASARTSPRSRAPAPLPAPAATPTRRRHSVSRAQLPTGEKLPRRGIVLHSWGLGGESIVTVDADAATLHIWENVVGRSRPRSHTRKVPAKTLAELVELADTAWTEEPTGAMAEATDVRVRRTRERGRR